MAYISSVSHAFRQSMNTIAEAQSFLDCQKKLAVWYAAYAGTEESVLYANPLFCETFHLTLDEVLKRQRYHLINPPDTTPETIAQYKADDREAIEREYFLQRSQNEAGKDNLVLKLRFDHGIVGMFKTVDSDLPEPIQWVDLDADFQRVMEALRPKFYATRFGTIQCSDKSKLA